MSTGGVSTFARGLLQRVHRALSGGYHQPDPIDLVRFQGLKDVEGWRVMSDATFGGSSHGQLVLKQEDTGLQYASFLGQYSQAINEGSELVRAGYVVMNKLLPRTVNLSMHDHLEYRVRCHQPYTLIASVRTEQLHAAGGEEAWQGLLQPTRVGEWETIRVPFHKLHFTFRGRMASSTHHTLSRPLREKVMGIGITLAATEDMPEQGSFRVDIERISASVAELAGAAAQARALNPDLSPEELEALEREEDMRRAAKQLDVPGRSRRAAEQ